VRGVQKEVGLRFSARDILRAEDAPFEAGEQAGRRQRETDALVLGYGGLSEPAIEEGIRRLAEVLDELPKEELNGD